MAIIELAMQFSLQTALFPLHYAMRTIMGLFPFEFWVISTPKREAVIFGSSQLVHTHARLISRSWCINIT